MALLLSSIIRVNNHAKLSIDVLEGTVYLVIYFVRVITIHRELKNLFHEDCIVGKEYNHYYMELREEYQENLCPCYFFKFSLFSSVYLKFLFAFPLIFYFEVFLHQLEQYVLNFLLECFHHINLAEFRRFRLPLLFLPQYRYLPFPYFSHHLYHQ